MTPPPASSPSPSSAAHSQAQSPFEVPILLGKREVVVQASIELPPSGKSPVGLAAIVDPFAATSPGASHLAERVAHELHERRLAVLCWEPACEHLIGVDYDRVLARHALDEILAVLTAGRNRFGEQGAALPLHVIAADIGTLLCCCVCSQLAPLASLSLIRPMLPRDVTRLAEHKADILQALPVGLLETVNSLDPLTELAALKPRTFMIAAAADRIAPLESAWSYQTTLATAGQPPAMLTMAREGRMLDDDDTVEFIARTVGEFVARCGDAPKSATPRA